MRKSKKKKNQDFQKVKLKIGKQLKKADNVTNASFKTRSIQISQKLKSGDSSQPSTKKRQNISELFTQCRHYSASVRLEAVNGFKELISSNPEILSPNLSTLLERAAELLIDKDSSVRQAAVRLFKLFLPMVSEKQISPFFPLLCAHLCCAMTHIYDEIQEDSLPVLDLLLETFPKLMITKSSQVLPNFIEQISRRQGQGKAKRSLSTNPNSSTSSVKWRISVLNRLHKFLGAIIKNGMQELSSDIQLDKTCVLGPPSTCEEVMYTSDSAMFVQPCPRRNRKAWTMPGFVLGGSGLDMETNSKSDVFDGQFMEYTNTLIPLMLECWVECAPSKQAKHVSGNMISGENVEMMFSILQVTQLLWQCIHSMDREQEDVTFHITKYLKDFQQHFMSSFPYSISPVSVKKKKSSTSVQVSAETLNLTICDIMTYFIGDENQNMPFDHAWLPMVSQYLSDFIGGVYGHAYIGQSSRIFVHIIERLISRGIQDDSMLGIIVEVFNRFQAANINSTEKTIYLRFFAEKMVSDGDLSTISPDLRRKFLRSLPELFPLCGKANHQMVNLLIGTMKKAACQRCSDMIDKTSLRIVGKQWFDPSTGILRSLSEHHQRELISLLYHMPIVDINLIQTLVNVVRCRQFSDSVVTYLIQVLQGRYQASWYRADVAAVHVGFLTNLILGMSQNDIDQSVSVDSDRSHVVSGNFTIVKPDDNDDDDGVSAFDRHNLILEIVCSALRQFNNSEQAVNVILQHFQNTVLSNNIVPLQVAFGICKFAESLTSMPSEFEPLINKLNISLVSHLVTCCDSSNQPTVKKMKDICCNLMLKCRTGLDKLIEIVCIDAGKAFDIERLGALLKTVMLVLTEGRHTSIQGHPDRLQSLTTLQTTLQELTEANKELITSENETLLVNFNYLLASVR